MWKLHTGSPAQAYRKSNPSLAALSFFPFTLHLRLSFNPSSFSLSSFPSFPCFFPFIPPCEFRLRTPCFWIRWKSSWGRTRALLFHTRLRRTTPRRCWRCRARSPWTREPSGGCRSRRVEEEERAGQQGGKYLAWERTCTHLTRLRTSRWCLSRLLASWLQVGIPCVYVCVCVYVRVCVYVHCRSKVWDQ